MRSFRLRLQLAWPVAAAFALVRADAWKDAAADFLAAGDAAVSEGRLAQAIETYAGGIRLLPKRWTGDESADDDEGGDDSEMPAADEIGVIMSLHTNYATALGYARGSDDDVLSSYRRACLCYRLWQREAESRGEALDAPRDVKEVAAQSYFLLGMTYQDLATAATDRGRQSEQLQHAARSYAAATKIDPNHWSSFANMGVVLADVGIDRSSGNEAVSLELYEEGTLAYQKAIAILTGAGNGDGNGDDEGPTDPPENVREVVSELHYRIGLCLAPFLFGPDEGKVDGGERKCTLRIGEDATPTTRSCLELAAYQFGTALQFHPNHDGAHAALTMTTADAVFGMSTDAKKVQSLFEDYAPTFEHSLVDELGYNGFDRMRRGFDRAMLSEGKKDEQFSLVLDAGCGTGLAGEVFRNISQSLVGVDLSPTIVGLAKEKRPNLYDELKVGDVKEVLGQYAQQKQQISLLVAADTFIYFNDLKDLFTTIMLGLEEGGYAVFSLENVSTDNERRLDQLKPDWRWQLTPSGRVAHRKEYVENVAKSHSLDVTLYERLDDFRAENGKGVRGHMFVLQKRAAQKDEL